MKILRKSICVCNLYSSWYGSTSCVYDLLDYQWYVGASLNLLWVETSSCSSPIVLLTSLKMREHLSLHTINWAMSEVDFSCCVYVSPMIISVARFPMSAVGNLISMDAATLSYNSIVKAHSLNRWWADSQFALHKMHLLPNCHPRFATCQNILGVISFSM